MYLTRIIEKTIEDKLSYIGAVQIEGPKWCGKSTTASRFANTIIKLQNPIVFRQYAVYATTNKEDLLSGERPILFDEWQKIPDIWDFVRDDVDEVGKPGQYLLTGSAKPMKEKTMHTGTGRIAKIKMRPLSLYESLDSNGTVSLNELFNNPNYKVKAECDLTINDQVNLVCRGGWPKVVSLEKNVAFKYMKDYYDGLVSTDITDVDEIKRDPKRAKAILRSYARNISTLAEYTTIMRDLENVGEGVNPKTLSSYINAFEKLFVIENVEAWNPKLRSATMIRQTPKKQFVDPSIAVLALSATANELEKDMETFGFFFESLVTRDLRIYVENIGGHVYFYRDRNNLEVDCILKLDDGRWAAVEVKVGSNKIEEAARSLLALRDNVDTRHMNEPSFMMIVYGGTYAYQRADGIYVVPIGCLKH
ncbi:MAG TPA: DUF4143 domain-containing protein [Bacilli bacterium]|nr:DUF4143 domain-containing protein [Bacilli bacterium]